MLPQNLIDLAKAFKAGVDVTIFLYDGLVEAGYPYAALECFGGGSKFGNCKPGTLCLSVDGILKGGLDCWEETCKSNQLKHDQVD